MSSSLFGFKTSSKAEIAVERLVSKQGELIMNVPNDDNAKNEVKRLLSEGKAEIEKMHGTSTDIKLLQEVVNKKMAMLESHTVSNPSTLFSPKKAEDADQPHSKAQPKGKAPARP